MRPIYAGKFWQEQYPQKHKETNSMWKGQDPHRVLWNADLALAIFRSVVLLILPKKKYTFNHN